MKISPSVVCELVGDDVVVLDSENSAVVTLTGDSAGVVRGVLAGENVSEGDSGVDELLAQGVLVSESPRGLSRRSVVVGGAALGVGGVFALSLPSAANASSSSLPTPELDFKALNDDNEPLSNWRDDTDSGGSRFVERIRIDKDDFLNANKFPAGFTLQWSFFSNFNQPKDFETRETRYQWGDQTNSVPLEADSVDSSNNLTIFVRVLSGGQFSPVVGIVLPPD